MASNRLPRRLEELFALAEHLADALSLHEAASGIKQTTEASLRADVAGARNANNAYRAAVSTNKVQTSAQTVADSKAKHSSLPPKVC